MTIEEEPDTEGQPSALVVVPDNQLSLAIGKKRQNARLAAKLTGLRIDIKSESELETERARPSGIGTSLAELRGLTPETLEALRAVGLDSPDAVVSMGRERLGELLTAPAHADEVFAAAEDWVARRASAPPSTGQAASGSSGGTEGA